MCKICQKCGSVAEYNAYYGRVTCTKCSCVSEIMSRKDSERYSCFEKKSNNTQKKYALSKA